MTDVDWKEKYRLLLEQQGIDESEREEVEKLLCRTITRLTLAASGLDPNLDPTLKNLRNAVRKGVNPALKDNLDALSDALMHADEHDETSTLDLFQRLLNRIQLVAKPAVQLTTIIKQLDTDSENVSDAQLDELLALLNPKASTTTTPETQSKPGLFGRIFKGGSTNETTESSTIADPNKILLNLLEKLNWPGHLAGDLATLMARLGKGANTDIWIPVLDDLGRLVTTALGDIQIEMRATEDFLGELTLRLQELDQHMIGSQSDQASSSENREILNAAVKGEVGQIQRSLAVATDLKTLKMDIAKRLDTIQYHVSAHMEAEEMRRKSAFVKEQALRNRMHKLEHETSSLQAKMVNAKSKALEDTVTGLPNRMAYEERLAIEVARWKRTQNPLVILVWDIDDFKQINDRFGHQAGDKALAVIGRILSERPRELDFVGRYGGEEFVMLLVDSSLDNAKTLANEIRESIASSGFHTSAKDKISITISCGIAEFCKGDTPEEVFARADEAMYQAKHQGKNRVIVG